MTMTLAPAGGTMTFAPAIDRRVARIVAGTRDITCSAVVWRAVRRRALRLRIATPSYQSLRLIVLAERGLRARLAATLATIAEIASRRIPVLPEDIPRIHARHLARRHAAGKARRQQPP